MDRRSASQQGPWIEKGEERPLARSTESSTKRMQKSTAETEVCNVVATMTMTLIRMRPLLVNDSVAKSHSLANKHQHQGGDNNNKEIRFNVLASFKIVLIADKFVRSGSDEWQLGKKDQLL